MKRTLPITLILILVLFLFPVKAAETVSTPAALRVSSVFGEVGKRGCKVPLTVELYGQSAAPFSGTLAVSTVESMESDSSEIYRYEYPVSVNMAETKVMELYVPLGQKSSEMFVTLSGADGKVFADGRLSFDISRESGRLVIGALTDRPERLDFFDNVNLDYGLVRTHLLAMNAETFPKDVRGLELLDVLLINEFETETLSADQQTAIIEWVEQGGTLLFGTGEYVGWTLSGFAEQFVSQVPEEPRYATISMGTEYSKEAPGDASIRALCVRLEVPGGEEVLISDGMTLLTTAEIGAGTVGFFVFDLGEMREFAARTPIYPIQLLTGILGDDAISEIYFYSAYGQDDEYWNAQSLVNSGNADRLPNLSLYVAVIAVYLLLVGPGSYLFLKKRELSRYYGRCVAGLSLVCAAIVWLIGVSTRFPAEFYTCATVLDASGGELKETSYLNVRTPDSRAFSMELPAEYEVSVLTRSERFGDMREAAPADGSDWNAALRFDEEATVLSAKRSHAFEPRFFKLECKEQFDGGVGKIVSDLTYLDGRLSGTIKNNYPFALEHAAVLFYGQVLPLGTMEAGEVRTLSGQKLLTWPPDSSNLLARNLAGAVESGVDGSDSDYLNSMGLTPLYAYYIDQYYGNYNAEARIAAIGQADGLDEFLVASGHTAFGRTLYTQTLNVSSGEEGLIYRSGLSHEPQITSGSGVSYGNAMTMYSMDPIVVEYFFGEDITVERVSFHPISQEFLSDPGYNYLRQFDGQAYFYNNNTGDYDEVLLSQTDFSASELIPYLTPENSLVVRYVARESDQAAYSLSLPLPMVTGRER